MFWVYKNLFFLFDKKSFFYQNFFFLNSFNYFFLIKLNKNFNFYNKSIIKTNNNFKFDNFYNLNLFNKKMFLLKYLKYFNKVFSIKGFVRKNNLIYYDTFNKHNFFVFSDFNFFYFKKLSNLIFQLNCENYNFVTLDKSYKNIFPVYNYMFNFKNLLVYKKYFFIDSNFFTYVNWSYYYNKFCKKFNIVLLVVLDFNYFNKFFKLLSKTNLPISSLIPVDNLNEFIDYPIFIFNFFHLEKFIFLNFLTQSVLISYNYKSYLYKKKYLETFYNFSLRFDLM